MSHLKTMVRINSRLECGHKEYFRNCSKIHVLIACDSSTKVSNYFYTPCCSSHFLALLGWGHLVHFNRCDSFKDNLDHEYALPV